MLGTDQDKFMFDRKQIRELIEESRRLKPYPYDSFEKEFIACPFGHEVKYVFRRENGEFSIYRDQYLIVEFACLADLQKKKYIKSFE